MTIYIVILSILIVLALLDAGKLPSYGLFCLCLFFIILVGIRGDIDNDHATYINVIKEGWGVSEISFIWISSFIYDLTGEPILVFILYAAIGITGMYVTLHNSSTNFWLSLVFYFCTYFVLIHNNAIRSGAGIGIYMLSWQYWAKKQWKETALILFAATLIHYSLVAPLCLVPLIQNDKKYLNYFIYAIPIAYLIHFAGDAFSVFSHMGLTFISAKANLYNKTISGELSVFSTVMLLRLCVISVLYYYKENLSKVCDKFYLLYKLYICGVIVAVVFANIPPVAMRFLDIFACTELILLPLICEIVRPKWIISIGIVAYALFYYYIYVITGEYIKPYETML